MKRQSLIAYGEPLQATEAEVPEPKGGEIIVKISHCGVCHSDLHLQDGYFNLGGDKQLDVRSGRELPFTLGHEIAGTVEAVGPDVEGVSPGEQYAVFPWIGCGECALCTSDQENLCKVQHHLGINVDGGYASHVVVPHARYLLDVSGIDPLLAGSYMCSGLTAFAALKKVAGHVAEGPLLITGLGGVGMMGLQFARALFPDAKIIAADIDPAKRELALKAGAAHVFDPAADDARKQVFKTCGAATASVDYVGAEGSFNFSQSVLDKGGIIAVAGLFGGKFTMPLPMLPMRIITIAGCFVGSLGEAKEMLDLVRQGAVDPIPVDLRPMDQASTALDDLRAGNVTGRIVLEV